MTFRRVLIYVCYSRVRHRLLSSHYTSIRQVYCGREGTEIICIIAPDGRISVSLNLKHELPDLPEDHAPDVKEFAVDREWKRFPMMNIVIMIVGSRG